MGTCPVCTSGHSHRVLESEKDSATPRDKRQVVFFANKRTFLQEERFTAVLFYMPQVAAKFLLVFLACGLCVATEVPHHTKSQKSPSKPSPAVAAQPTVQPQAPPPPVTPEHGPSSPPDVNFQSGQLTIVARNSTLGDVLNAVKLKTGASVDMPPASGERVVGQFGPGSPRDVMAQLLNGSHYDYVLLGSPADPGALKKIVLMAKASGPDGEQPGQQVDQPVNQPLQAVPDVESENPDEANEPPQPMMQQPDEDQPTADQQDQQQQGQPAVKTPEQLLQELRQQQQQQQEQQQNQSGPPGAPGQPPQQQ